MNVLLSGGSRGLGLAIVERLLANGHKVSTFARSTTAEMTSLQDAHPNSFRFTAIDAVDTDALATVIKTMQTEWGGVDALVNNAAVGQDSLLAHTSDTDIERLIAINVTAPIKLTRLAVRSMLRTGKAGQVLTIGSIGAGTGYAGLTVYSATKGALESFTRSLAHEMKGRIRANVIAPGFFASEMSSVLQPEQLDTITRRTPTGTLTTPEQVADAVVYVLESDINLNAVVLPMDGGASS